MPEFIPGNHYRATGGRIAYIAHQCQGTKSLLGFVEHGANQIAHIWDHAGNRIFGAYSLVGDLSEDQRMTLERRIWRDAGG